VDEVDGFRHFLGAGGRYFIGGRTQVFLRDNFSYSEAVSGIESIDEAGIPTINSFDSPVSRNRGTLGVQHAFTPRLTGNLAFTHRLFDTDLPGRANNMVYVGNGGFNYSLSERHQVGGGLAGTLQDFDESNNGSRPPSQTYFVNFFGTWSWFIDEVTTFAITAGPTFVKSNQDAPETSLSGAPLIPFASGGSDFSTSPIRVGLFAACPLVNGQPAVPLGAICGGDPVDTVFLPGDPVHTEATTNATTETYSFVGDPFGLTDSTWTLFGEASLSRRWTPNLVSTLSYQRTDSTASGIAGGATVDFVSFLTTWKITELWTASVRADFTRRESVSPTTETFVVVEPSTVDPTIAQATGELIQTVVNQELDTNRWGASAALSRRLTENLRVSVRYIFNIQSSQSGTAGSVSDFDDHLVSLGIVYDFDRFNLW
jgi:hypothetical protein